MSRRTSRRGPTTSTVHNCRSALVILAVTMLAVVPRSEHSALVQGFAKALAAAVLSCGVTSACGLPAAETPSTVSFCSSADKLFNDETFASDGGGVVDAIRGLDLTNLASADRDEVSSAIETVAANIAAFNNGQAPDGWSTEPAAAVAARICGIDMSSFFVVP